MHKLVKDYQNRISLLECIAENPDNGGLFVVYSTMYGTYKKYTEQIDLFLAEVDTVKHPNATQKI